MNRDTICVQGGYTPGNGEPRQIPIVQSTTFKYATSQDMGKLFDLEANGYFYSRLQNPTCDYVAAEIASLEGGTAAMLTSSGQAANFFALFNICEAGDHIVASSTIYGGTFNLLRHTLPRDGITTTFVSAENPQEFEDAIQENTKLVYFETFGNPNADLPDFEAITAIAHKHHLPVIVDNTFCTPYLQRPLELGADVVVHSATKYLNGHGDVIAGIVVGKADFISQCRMFGLKDMTGAVLSPFDAFLMARGLKTLDIRMERHCANAQKVAAFFTSHPAVAKVYYPGLDTFPGHEIAAKQMKLPGGMISIELKADRAAVAAALNKLQLCTIAVSLGDAETLVEHPATMTHSTYSAEELAAAGISEGLVRISVGLEDPEDIIDDFKTVLDTL